MNFYLTRNTKEKLCNSFINLKKHIIVDAFEITESLGYNLSEDLTTYSHFIINERIKNIIKNASQKKKHGIIYTNDVITIDITVNLIEFLKTIPAIKNIYLLSDKEKDIEFYNLFDNVMYFSPKKNHIFNCETYK